MAPICYSGPISAVSTDEQIFGEKRTCAKFQIGISKTERLVRVYTNRRTNGYDYIDSARHADHFIYISIFRACDVSYCVLQTPWQT